MKALALAVLAVALAIAVLAVLALSSCIPDARAQAVGGGGAVGGGAVGDGAVGGGSAASCGLPPGSPALWVDGTDLDGSGNSTLTDGAEFDGTPTITNKGSLGGTFAGAAGASPVFESDCIGWPKRSCISFDGVNDKATSSLAASNWSFLHSDTGYTCMAIVRQSVYASDSDLTIYATATTSTSDVGNNTRLESAGSDELRPWVYHKKGGSVTNLSATASTSTYFPQIWNRFILDWHYGAAGQDFNGYLDGAQAWDGEPTTTGNSGNPSSTLVLGATVNADWFEGDIYQLVCYSPDLSSDVRSSLDSWGDCMETGRAQGPMEPLSSSSLCSANSRPCVIAVMGDSITAFGNPGAGTKMSWSNGYLRTTYPTSHMFWNFAQSSTTIEGGKTTFWTNEIRPLVVAGQVHALAIAYGTNDIAAGYSSSEILADFDEVIADANSLGVKVVVTDIIPRGNSSGWNGSLQTILDTVNAGFASRADGYRVYYASTYADLEEPIDTDDLAAAYDVGDGLHPNQAGCDAQGAAVDADIAF